MVVSATTNFPRCVWLPAYSDSNNDLPMLELVGYPNAVNTDPQLRAIARERDWPIHDFRKGRRSP